MLVYFSGTGNSKYCAEKIAAGIGSEVSSLNNMMKNNIRELDLHGDSVLGFVCPTYDFDLAFAAAELIDDISIKNIPENCYVFAVFTCGKSGGTAEKTMKELLDRIGIKLNAAFKIEMQDNYIPMFPLISKDEQQKVLADAEISLDAVINNIKAQNSAVITTAQMPAPMRFIIKKVAVPNQRKATKNFWVKDSCIGCGLCEKICPKNIIKITYGKPRWTKDDCACFLGCIHRCPKQAIQYGKKTERTGRYVNPNVTM